MADSRWPLIIELLLFTELAAFSMIVGSNNRQHYYECAYDLEHPYLVYY